MMIALHKSARTTPAQEHVVVQLRRTLLLPLDDLLAVTREFLCSKASRSGIDRCLRRHGVGNLNARIADVLKTHHFHSGQDLEQTLMRYVTLYNHQLPQSALKSKTPMQAMKEWYASRPDLFHKRPYDRPGCDKTMVSMRCACRTCRRSGNSCGTCLAVAAPRVASQPLPAEQKNRGQLQRQARAV